MTLPNKIFPYTVTRFEWLTPKVFRLDVAPKEGSVFPFKAGQFVMVRILNSDGTLWKAKAFSLCSTPQTQGYIELGVKLYGEFTHRVAELKIGDSIEIAGPYGVFTVPETATSVVMMAGGIGITPFLSMIREITQQHRPTNVTLLYSNPSVEETAYRTELDAIMQHNNNIAVRYFLTQEPAPDGFIAGRLQPDELERYCSVLEATTLFYLCGPDSFMQELTQHLLDTGVERSRIKMEKF